MFTEHIKVQDQCINANNSLTIVIACVTQSVLLQSVSTFSAGEDTKDDGREFIFSSECLSDSASTASMEIPSGISWN